MKKIILTVAAVFAFGVANAQIKTEAGTFNKPTTGTYIMEATMTPNVTGGGIFALPTLNSDLGLLGIKVRKFNSDKTATRMAANLSVLSSGKLDVAGEKEATEFALGFSYGVENHMAGAERLSTYWGYEGNVGYVSMNARDLAGDATGDKTNKIGLGGNVFTGFDYYIMPKIYLGVEVSYGLAVTNSKTGDADGVTKIQLAPGITPTFRLGWQF
jgi:hypothetical protein